MIAIKLKLGQAGNCCCCCWDWQLYLPIGKHDVRKMARKIAKGNCHKKAATKKAAKQFIVAAPRYSILWLSGKHIHIHMQTYTQIRAHSSTLRAVHTPMHFYCSILLCAAKTIFVILPARGFRCFLRSFLSLHTHRQVSKVCVCVSVCRVVHGAHLSGAFA